MKFNINDLAWEKMHGLLPAIVQDAASSSVLMLGYMNQDALLKTIETRLVTFFSRSKNRLWTKGEISGNKLELIDIYVDCDKDALLINANPSGPICHFGHPTCFGAANQTDWTFVMQLESIIRERKLSGSENSYTAKLLKSGISRIAQKVGEEGVEVALAAIEKEDGILNAEIADLLFHILVLLSARNQDISQAIKVLKQRNV